MIGVIEQGLGKIKDIASAAAAPAPEPGRQGHNGNAKASRAAEHDPDSHTVRDSGYAFHTRDSTAKSTR
jgi:hypothetical protein